MPEPTPYLSQCLGERTRARVRVRVRVSKGASDYISNEPLDLFLFCFFTQCSLAKSKENVAFKNLIAARVQ